MLRYPLTISIDEKNREFIGSFDDFPGADTAGDSEAEVVENARRTLESAVLRCVQDRRPLPKPSPLRGRRPVSLEGMTQAKVQLWQALFERRMTKTELARRLGWHMPQINRLFDPRHASRIEQLQAAASVLGKRIDVVVSDANG